MAFVLPSLGQISIGEVVGAIVEGVAVAVDGDAIGLASPGSNWSLEVAHIIIHVDLLLHPVWHFGSKALAAHISFKGRTHFDDVEVHRTGGDRLLKTRIVIGLSKVDPVDLGAGVSFPWLQEAAEQQVVKILVVEAHETQLNALEFTFLDVLFGRSQGKVRRPSASPHPLESPC